MKIYAHRGASAHYPENTMIAFQKAAEMGVDGIEADVHLTKDGHIVICHDETIDRTTDHTGLIANMTYAELLRADAGIQKGTQFAGQKIPLLRDLLILGSMSGIELNLELKNYAFDYPGLEEKIIEEAKKYYRPEKILLSSFRHASMVRAKALSEEIQTGLLFSCDIYCIGSYASSCKADAINPDYTMLSEETVCDAKAHGLSINVWTVDDPGEILRMQRMGVDALITNEPQLALGILQRRE